MLQNKPITSLPSLSLKPDYPNFPGFTMFLVILTETSGGTLAYLFSLSLPNILVKYFSLSPHNPP